MGFIAAGLVVAAAGATAAAYGTAQNAKAMKAANEQNADSEDALYARQSNNLNKLIKAKEQKLYNLGNIFDRFESTGAFGNTETLKNLRTAQEDFSQLAAGDFTGFEAQLRKSMSDALVGTVGSGSPIGAYAQLAADTQMDYRKQGIQTTVGISEFLSNEANKLLGAEFGIMDQKFNSLYEMDRTKVSNKANYALGAAATEGVGMQAYGNAAQQIGSSVASYGMSSQTMGMQQQSINNAKQYNMAALNARGSNMNSYSAAPALASTGYNFTSGGATSRSTSSGSAVVPEPMLPIYSDPPDQFNNPFSYGSGYKRMNYEPDLGVLPPLTYNSSLSTLSSIGSRIASA